MDQQLSMIPIGLSVVSAKNALPPHWCRTFQTLIGSYNGVRCKTRNSLDTIYSDLLSGELPDNDLVTVGDAWLTDLIRKKAILPFDEPLSYKHLHALPTRANDRLCVQLVSPSAEALVSIRSAKW